MKVNMTMSILDYDGTEVKDITDGESNKPLTVRATIYTALNTFMQEERDNLDKDKLFELTMRAYSADEVDYDTEEAAVIIERVRKIYNPLVLGRIKQLFEIKDKVAEK